MGQGNEIDTHYSCLLEKTTLRTDLPYFHRFVITLSTENNSEHLEIQDTL